ncbi:MAG: phosphatase [Gammaproteobacteria bacterium]|jgi:long-subunit acyl-CoA synthetase (AMP-forming)|nr:phosphatase [Gammaproteobacteria bacterium]
MSFWELAAYSPDGIVIDCHATGSWSKQKLTQLVDSIKRYLPAIKNTMGLIIGDNQLAFIATYLAALQCRQVPLLLSGKTSTELIEYFIQGYQPTWLMLPAQLNIVSQDFTVVWSDLGYQLLLKQHCDENSEIHPDLALLLSTSGTTGSPKLVRLSYRNLEANARSIAEYLKLDETERPITNLPLYYSYGLSVLNSHLLVGARILLTDQAITSRDFWTFAKEKSLTSLVGVPYTYQVLRQLRFNTMQLPSLRYMTQAGGKAQEDLLSFFAAWSLEKNLPFYVMYGQTEATARMSYLPPHLLHEKINSVGIAIPQGSFCIDGATHELVYRGPNVMLGYAENLQDLRLGDCMQGVLSTGDLAEQDSEGCIYIKGRLKRFAKLYGLRINLDDVEKAIDAKFKVEAVCVSDDNRLFVFCIAETGLPATLALEIARLLNIDPRCVLIKEMAEVLRNSSGKIAYQKYMELI